MLRIGQGTPNAAAESTCPASDAGHGLRCSLSGAMREITDETFEAEVARAGKPVVIDFWAPWCGPCKAVEPILEDLAEKHADRVEFTKLNIDENPLVASRYGVLAIPTAILFEGGEAKETVVGARSRSHYEDAWAQWLGPTS
jgi:thioredoxin